MLQSKTMTVKDYPRHLAGMPHARMVSHLDKTVDTDFPAYTYCGFCHKLTLCPAEHAAMHDRRSIRKWDDMGDRPKRNGRAKRSPDGNLS